MITSKKDPYLSRRHGKPAKLKRKFRLAVTGCYGGRIEVSYLQKYRQCRGLKMGRNIDRDSNGCKSDVLAPSAP